MRALPPLVASLALVTAPLVTTGLAAQRTGPQLAYHPLVEAAGAVEELAPPVWLKPGLRLTFWGGSATTKHHAFGKKLVPSANGNVEVGGKKYTLGDIGSGHGGCGFVQIDVLSVRDGIVACDVRHYLGSSGVGLGPARLFQFTPLIAHGSGCDWWIHPTVLAKLAANPEQSGFQACDWVHDGQRRRAALMWHKTAKFSMGYVYDLETGVLLSYSSRGETSLGNHATVNSNGTGTVTWGGNTATNTAVMRFVSKRMKRLPWANEAAPDWAGTVKALAWRGSHATQVTGVPTVSFPVTTRERVVRAGSDWFMTSADVRMTTPYSRPIESHANRLFGPAQIGGLWIPPSALRALRAGQTLDTDALTRVRLVVAGTDAHRVTLVEVGGSGRVSWLYERASGRLISVLVVDDHGSGRTIRQLDLER